MEQNELNKEKQEQQEPQTEQPREPESVQLEELQNKLTEALQQVETYKDLLLRKAADFDNFKKRVESETLTLARIAKIDLLSAFLPIVDDFERSLKLSRDRRDSEAFVKGIDLIYQKLMKFLSQQGLQPMETVGKEFDVELHDALLQVPRNDVPPNTIIEEVEKGYLLDDRVVRHAKVIVSAPGGGEKAAAEQNVNTEESSSRTDGS